MCINFATSASQVGLTRIGALDGDVATPQGVLGYKVVKNKGGRLVSGEAEAPLRRGVWLEAKEPTKAQAERIILDRDTYRKGFHVYLSKDTALDQAYETGWGESNNAFVVEVVLKDITLYDLRSRVAVGNKLYILGEVKRVSR